MYDIYLLIGCQQSPDFRDLIEQAPILADPTLQAKIVQRSSAPGFLGLDLPENVAGDLLQHLIAAGALGQRILAAYRQPGITIEQATIIAEQIIAEQQTTLFPNQTFGSAHLASSQPQWWSFKALSKEDVLFVTVDKLDGHIWQKEDVNASSNERDQLRLHALKKAKLVEPPIDHWRKLFDRYDIYLLTPCRTLPNMDDFVQTIPILGDPIFQQRLLQGSLELGFLELDLSEEMANSLLQRLKSAGAGGYRLPSAYRQPSITLEQARSIAQSALLELQSTRLGYTLGTVRFLWDRAMLRVFGALWDPPVKTEGGGMAYARVDKLDGHIWTSEEMDLLSLE